MNLNSSEYTVIDDMIIIHDGVNKPIGIIDKKFKKLIFSNYNDINISIQLNNKYDFVNNGWNSSIFNYSISLTDFLTHLTSEIKINHLIYFCSRIYLIHWKN